MSNNDNNCGCSVRSPCAGVTIPVSPSMEFALYANRAEVAAEKAEAKANEIEELVANIGDGNIVVDVTEENGTITVAKSNGEESAISVVKSVNGVSADENGNVVIPNLIQVKVLD